MMLLTTLLSTCQSNRVEYVEKTVLATLEFPPFPEQAEFAIRDKAARTVTVPEDWIVSIEVFSIQYEKLEKDYNGLKALYEK